MRLPKPKKYSIDDLKKAIKDSFSIRQTLSKLNIRNCGGNYSSIKNMIKVYEIDISHFSGQSWSKGRVLGKKHSIEKYLNGEFKITSHQLRLRLIKEGFFESKCYSCNLYEWLGKPISLELEHIDGDHSNNSLKNLTILCPNCHSQTKTYRGRNKRKICNPTQICTGTR